MYCRATPVGGDGLLVGTAGYIHVLYQTQTWDSILDGGISGVSLNLVH